MKEYRRKDCTHILSCRHCIGHNCFEYTMPCIPLKKILVFGDRYWDYNLEQKRIRYVESRRVKEIK